MKEFETIMKEFGTIPSHAEGVWAVVDNHYADYISEVHPTEVEALRVLNGRGYGRVMFVPWGTTLPALQEETD